MRDTVAGLIGIVGPTAIGKTAVAVHLTELLGGRAEILSADSVQIYRRLDIGSAKPSAAEQARARFHLIDIADPNQDFTLADYQRHAQVAYGRICSRGSAPLLVGGAGLYFRSVTQPLGLPHVPPNPEIRARWQEFGAANGPGSLHRRLAQSDPESAARLHVNDERRIIRALEVLECTGRPLSDWHREDRASGRSLLPVAAIYGLNRERRELYRMIEERVDSMFRDGLVEEVETLRRYGLDRNLNSMRTLGYNEVNAYLDFEITLSECIDTMKRRTRQYARRQLIWFRADARIAWIDTGSRDAASIAEQIAESIDRE